MPSRKATGIIWIGPVYDRGGYGNVSRNYVLGLRMIGVPVRVINFGQTHGGLDTEILHILKEMEETDVGNYPVGVVNYAPDLYPWVKFRNVVKTVGCTIFETDRVPGKWVPLLNKMDEVWVPSQFNRKTFCYSGVDPKKIRVIPYAVDTDYYKPITETLPILDKKGFSFLYVFAFGWRKGFDVLLEAYLKEFTASDDVTLILKVYQWRHEKEKIKKMILDSVHGRIDVKDGKLPHFIIMDSALNQNEMRLLYNTCDVYISTDRANGWGMPCMETMAMGKPAATIDWSGSTEFMNNTNSLLIHPEERMVPVDSRLSQDLPDLYGGHRWPEVSIKEIRRVLRLAFEQRASLQKIGRCGMEDIRQKYSLAKVATYINENLIAEQPTLRRWYSILPATPQVRILFPPKRRWRKLRNKIKQFIRSM